MVATACGFAACGGSVTGNPATGGGNDAGNTANEGGANAPDAGADIPDAAPDVDHGQPSTTYPAFKVDGATLVNNGGDVLKTPIIVTVTWDTDPLADQLEAFGDAIGGTDYWKAVTSEYGITSTTSGAANHIRIPVTTASPLPTAMSDTDLDTFVANNAGVPANSMWPAPTDQTIYILYLHPSTSLQFNGQDACQAGIGGYHQDTQVNGQPVAYAIVPRCTHGTTSAFDETTESASHELGEASLDPHPNANAGIVGFDDNHLAYEFFQQFQSENGDACEFFKDSFYKEADPFSYMVQRQWSNASSLAGHNPCVPAPAGAYFNVTPLALDTVTVDLSRLGASTMFMTKGMHIKPGETKTFPVGLFSDGPTNGPWSIRVTESSPFGPAKTSHLKASIDRTMGQNGDIAYVTVAVSTAGTTKSEFITVVSSNSSTTHYMPILIGSM
jgi:hypothetical protein